MTKPKHPHGVDCVHGKHECWGYDDGDAATVTIDPDGRKLKVLMPDDLADIKVQVTAESGKFLFMLGTLFQKFADRSCGVMLVAKEKKENTYEVGVWHELYPYALDYFGLAGAKAEK